MLEKIRYVNHLNESIEFGEYNIFVNHNDLHDFEWAINSKGNKITSFSKGIVSKKVPLIIKCNSADEGIALRNKLFEVCEKDVLAVTHGKLYVGDYYLMCYVTASTKHDYYTHRSYMESEITITTDYASWIKETTIRFEKKTENDSEEQVTDKRNHDYNYDFPYDFKSIKNNSHLINDSFIPTDFRMIIYGECKNPIISIGGHLYQVFVELSNNEKLLIDSVSKKIIHTKYNGKEINCFSKRNKESYIFEKIPAGDNLVICNGQYAFDVVLYEERSEPKWT